MGVSGSSLLDQKESSFIKDQAEAELKAFSPFYRTQFSVTRFHQLEEDLEQNKDQITQLLKQRDAPEGGAVLYEEAVLYFDETRKWRERYVVVRANYCLECHDSLESFLKGVPARHKLLPTGGSVLTTEEKYNMMVDKCFPDDTNVKEDLAPPLSSMPGQFPVYLRLPYRRDSYFCFRQQLKQEAFLSIMSDCIRHQNQDFLKKKTCEVQAFVKAVCFYRQAKGHYEAWDMLIGSDVRVMANLVMEQLLPSLQKDLLPRLKAKKTEKKRVWFATVEAAYILVQEHLLEGLSALKEEWRTEVRQQEQQIHSDMEAIISSRRQLEQRVRDKVWLWAEQLCAEAVQPYMGSVLDELMEPISCGFQEGRHLSETLMEQVYQDFLRGEDNEQLKKALLDMSRPNLLSCYQKMASLQEKLQLLQDRFGFSNVLGIIHSAQIDLQQLMENASFTFEQLLTKALQDHPDNAAPAIQKSKHRVLKQYDYDSSSMRKRILKEALTSITLPFIKRRLDHSVRTELQDMEQFIFSDHTNFIHMENVYEDVLLQILDKEVAKVVKEAASLRKFNLITDSRDLLSESSRSSLSSPSASTPNSPAASPVSAASSRTPTTPRPLSPLVLNGMSTSGPESPQQQDKDQDVSKIAAIETPLGRVELKENLVQVENVVQVEKEAETQKEAEPEEAPSAEPLTEEHVEAPRKEEEAAQTLSSAAPPVSEDPPPVQPHPPASTSTSDPNSLDVSVGSESPPSDLESVEDDDVPTTDRLEGEEPRRSPASSHPEEDVQSKDASPEQSSNIGAPPPAVHAPPPTAESTPPAVDAPPPTAEATPPAVDDLPPTAETTPPAVDAPPPTAETTPPAVDAPPPTAESTPPAVDAPHPTAEATPPAVDDPPPTAETTPPAVDAPLPTAEATPPAVDAPPPTAEATPPAVDAPPPTAEATPPAVDAPPPTAEATPPAVGDPPPTAEATPPAVDAPPATAEATPPAVDDPPPTAETTPPAVDAPPPTAEATPPVIDAPPATAEATPPAFDPPPPTAEATPPAVDAPPPAAEATPLDCIREIRELVVEVIEVEELVQHYPSGTLKNDEE